MRTLLKFSKEHRGAVNIIATMLIFALMISSIGVLFGQISPTLLGYQTRTTSINQEFIMQTVANEMFDLAGSTSGSQGRIHIISDQTKFDVTQGQQISITIQGLIGGNQTFSENIGEFTSAVNGSFLPTSSTSYLNRVLNENTYIQNATSDSSQNYVSKAQYTRNEGIFTLYFRPKITITQMNSGNYILTIVFYKIDFLKSVLDSSPLNFPIQKDEWTLRMRRQSSTVTSAPFTIAPPLIISHTSDGTSGTTYRFPSASAGSIEIRQIIVPVLFTI